MNMVSNLCPSISLGLGANSDHGYWQDIDELETLMNSKVAAFLLCLSFFFVGVSMYVYLCVYLNLLLICPTWHEYKKHI